MCTDVILCYLYAPDATGDVGDFGDGTQIKSHRTTRMCFPMVPFTPVQMDDFRTYYGVQDVDFETLEYKDACDARAVRSTLTTFGEDMAENVITLAPFGAMLRFAEGLDALENLRRSTTNTTGVERASAVACGIAQLGGLIFSALTIAVAMLLCICAPLGGTCAIVLYRRNAMSAAIAKRDAQTLSRAKAFLDERDNTANAANAANAELLAEDPTALEPTAETSLLVFKLP